jgi:hypothetical protein
MRGALVSCPSALLFNCAHRRSFFAFAPTHALQAPALFTTRRRKPNLANLEMDDVHHDVSSLVQ